MSFRILFTDSSLLNRKLTAKLFIFYRLSDPPEDEINVERIILAFYRTHYDGFDLLG